MMMKLISKVYFCLSGWTAAGGLPPEVKKCVMIAAPHTSNFDFSLARAGCYLLNIKLRYLIKKDWMLFPLGAFFRSTGAIAVERSKTSNMVDKLIELLNKSDELVLMISPEGTRKTTRKWKTGFYYAALGANVPIVLAYLDYKEKIACIGPVIYPTGDYIKDMEPVKEFYKNITPKYPANYSLEIT
ncbi:MAG: 1-acyl-sn-glycerol-3-phosphate acyltransferase [Bacillota bacterium]|jgi:1-acyl-sn-glycerol-3-phosphate acyltransferase